jgi:hypothetical protein
MEERRRQHRASVIEDDWRQAWDDAPHIIEEAGAKRAAAMAASVRRGFRRVSSWLRHRLARSSSARVRPV